MSTTREYEITYTLDPSLDEAKRVELTSAIDSKIDELKGSISTNSETTRRKLAYPIKKQRMGFLRMIQAQLPADQVGTLRHDIKKMAGVLRMTIIQTAARQDVTTAIFDTVTKQQTEPKAAVAPKKAAKPVTDEEVEAKIEEALDEEVK
jgi:ribosomal protein S6